MQHIENPMIRFDPVFTSQYITLCACKCGESVTTGWAYLRWEDKYFAEQSCLIEYMKREEDFEEVL